MVSGDESNINIVVQCNMVCVYLLLVPHPLACHLPPFLFEFESLRLVTRTHNLQHNNMGQDFTLFPETIALFDVGYDQPTVRDDRGQVDQESLHLERLHSLLYLEGSTAWEGGLAVVCVCVSLSLSVSLSLCLSVCLSAWCKESSADLSRACVCELCLASLIANSGRPPLQAADSDHMMPSPRGCCRPPTGCTPLPGSPGPDALRTLHRRWRWSDIGLQWMGM